MSTETATNASDATPANDALLAVYHGDRLVCSERLQPGSYALIGSSDVCGMTVPDALLAPIHCALRFETDGFCIEDWHSESGVSVDGARITGQQQVTSASDIRLGEHQLRIEVSSDSASDPPVARESTEPEPEVAPAAEFDPDESQIEAELLSETAQVAVDAPEPAKREIVPPAVDLPLDIEPLRPSDDLPPADCQDEEIELLRAEIEQLQYELAERDAQLSELAPSDRNGDSEWDTEGDDDDQLLARLEDLLSELERNDERCGMLEQLLQVSEDKHRAEQEERRHLTEWVNDIEERIGEREGEWKAERDALTHRVASLQAERDELMRQLSEPRPDGTPSAEDEQMQAVNLQLQKELHEARDRHSQLETEIRERDKQLAGKTSADNELRAEHLKLAQDRAALARQQAELTTKLAETNQLPSKPETEIDCRLREFRQHLREIHDKEQQNPRTVTSRLARIWAKLDG